MVDGVALFVVSEKPVTDGCLGYRGCSLLPLDGRGWLAGDVVDDAIDASNFVDDPRAYPGEDVKRDPGPVRRHPIVAGDSPQSHEILVGAVVAHNSHAFQRREHGERLPDLLTQSGYFDLFA